MNQDEKQAYFDTNKAKLLDEISIAKIDILQNKQIKFLSPVIFRKAPMFRTDLPVSTAGTDGKDIFVDVEFWIKIDRAQRHRAIVHEGLHMAMGHCDFKVNSKNDHQIRNIAADCWVESMCTQCNVGRGNYVPGVINPTAHGNVNLEINKKKILISECHNKSVDDIYAIIKKHIKENPPEGGNGYGDNPIDIRDDNGNPVNQFDSHDFREFTPEEKNEVESTLRKMLVEHKLKGTMPGGLADMIEEMIKGRVNWRAELRDCIIPEIKSYQSYTRPHRKGLSSGLILPTMKKEGVNVHIAGDTSGSIGKVEMSYFTGETTSLFNQFDPGTVFGKLMLHNTHVYNTIDLKDAKDLAKIQTESGGTSHKDVFRMAEEDKANVLILFTDGYSDFPESTNIRKVLWICTDEKGMEQIPDNLGRKIFIDINEFKED